MATSWVNLNGTADTIPYADLYKQPDFLLCERAKFLRGETKNIRVWIGVSLERIVQERFSLCQIFLNMYERCLRDWGFLPSLKLRRTGRKGNAGFDFRLSTLK